jgi:hypothetical protein
MKDQIDFEELSGQATFCELLARIHDACMTDQKLEPHKTPTTWILPVQILADHLDTLGHHAAADNVRLIIRQGMNRWFAEEFYRDGGRNSCEIKFSLLPEKYK